MVTETKSKKKIKKYQVLANLEVVAITDGVRAARMLAKKMAVEIGASKVKQDLWSSGKTAIKIERLYDEL